MMAIEGQHLYVIRLGLRCRGMQWADHAFFPPPPLGSLISSRCPTIFPSASAISCSMVPRSLSPAGLPSRHEVMLTWVSGLCDSRMEATAGEVMTSLLEAPRNEADIAHSHR